MENSKNLENLREEITELTDQIMELFCKRQQLMIKVAEEKLKKAASEGTKLENIKIYQAERELALRQRYDNFSYEYQINRSHIHSLLQTLLSVAKAEQKEYISKFQTVENFINHQKQKVE